MPPGCPFTPRCPRALDACASMPALMDEEAGKAASRRFACWNPR
jgi:peptide/nickel transport system ATP-binding protein/oligopeptide transport system ATP-binding protein